MNKQVTMILATGFICALGLKYAGAAEVHVIDGDTLRIGQYKIRIHGIDAPERRQPGGSAATNELRRLISTAEELVCTPVEKDKYQRTVAVCYADGIDIGRAMVRSGNALAYVKYGGRTYLTDQQSVSFQEPWVWRADHRR